MLVLVLLPVMSELAVLTGALPFAGGAPPFSEALGVVVPSDILPCLSRFWGGKSPEEGTGSAIMNNLDFGLGLLTCDRSDQAQAGERERPGAIRVWPAGWGRGQAGEDQP